MFNSVLARRLTAVAGIAMLAACASSGASSGGSSGSDRYTITAAELSSAGADNLYQAIEKLRPDFFRQRGNTMAAGGQIGSSRGGSPAPEQSSSTATAVAGGPLPLKVYQNDTMLMGTDDLRQIPLSSVLEVKFVPGPQAGVRYGTNHSGGVILVRTK